MIIASVCFYRSVEFDLFCLCGTAASESYVGRFLPARLLLVGCGSGPLQKPPRLVPHDGPSNSWRSYACWCQRAAELWARSPVHWKTELKAVCGFMCSRDNLFETKISYVCLSFVVLSGCMFTFACWACLNVVGRAYIWFLVHVLCVCVCVCVFRFESVCLWLWSHICFRQHLVCLHAWRWSL